jgi:hypothetical protein
MDHWHQVKTQLQLINIISYQMNIAQCHERVLKWAGIVFTNIISHLQITAVFACIIENYIKSVGDILP